MAVAICAWSTNLAFFVHSKSPPSPAHTICSKNRESYMRVICIDIALVSIPIHPPSDFGLQDLSLSADSRDVVADPERLQCSKYRDYHKNHDRPVGFGCRLMLHNACWPASLALSRHHVRLGAIPLEPGRWCGIAAPALIAYMFPVKGSDLALLGNSSGTSPSGQSDRCLTCPAFDSLSFFTVGVYLPEFEL
jgi:hypothetical protein